MTRTIYTYERHNLGDQLVFLHLARALAKQEPGGMFVHFCNGCHIHQLSEVVADLPNIVLLPFENPLWREKEREAICVWKNAGATDTRHGESANYQQGFWEKSKNRWDWSAFTLEHHAWTAKRMGLQSPFTRREHLLFDYPALEYGNNAAPGYDFLIINSEPCSGQFKPMAEHGSGYLDGLIEALFRSGNSIVLTNGTHKMQEWQDIGEPRGEIFVLGGPSSFTISQIGNLSLRCKNIIGVATGPFFPTLNTTNHHNHEGRKRIVLLDNSEHLNMPHILQFTGVEPVMEIARTENWI
jgi:hypothetical protein